MKCAKAQWLCPGYPPRLKFLDDGVKLRRKSSFNLKKRDHEPAVKGKTIAAIKSKCGERSSHAGNSSMARPASHYATSLMPRSPIQSMPLSFDELLAQRFTTTFSSNLPMGQSLNKFGSFIQGVPRHVGASTACDFTIRAICFAHNTLLTGNEQSLNQSRIQYGKALAELQHILADRTPAISTETSFATMLLGIYEVRKTVFILKWF